MGSNKKSESFKNELHPKKTTVVKLVFVSPGIWRVTTVVGLGYKINQLAGAPSQQVTPFSVVVPLVVILVHFLALALALSNAAPVGPRCLFLNFNECLPSPRTSKANLDNLVWKKILTTAREPLSLSISAVGLDDRTNKSELLWIIFSPIDPGCCCWSLVFRRWKTFACDLARLLKNNLNSARRAISSRPITSGLSTSIRVVYVSPRDWILSTVVQIKTIEIDSESIR